MAFKVNYNQQRADRERAKQARKDAKLREQEAELLRRRDAQRTGAASPLPHQDEAEPDATA